MTDVTGNLQQLKRIGVKFIDFTGGEPLLHPQLPDMLILAKQLGFYTSVTTNCLLYDDRANELHGLVDLLHFSLDSLNPDVHNGLRGRSTFDSVMTSIATAQALGETPDLLFTVTPENIDSIDRLSEFAAEQRLMLIVNPIFKYCGQPELTMGMLERLDRYARKPYIYINAALHKLIRAGGNNTQYPRCYAVSSSVVISPDNCVLVPCFHRAATRLPIRGNLQHILESAEYKQQQQMQGKHDFCAHCTINCYFDPSFQYRLDSYLILSILSKAKYGFDKYIRRRLA